MGIIQGIVYLLIYFALIFFGAKSAGIDDVTYGKSILVAIVTWLGGFLLAAIFWPLTHIWFIGWIFAVALGMLATAVGARFVLKASWDAAFKIAMFVAVATLVLKVVGWLLRGIGGILA